MSKYEVIKRLDNYQYTEDCPVFITGGNLLKEIDNGHIYVQFKLRSLSQKTISAIILSVDCFDIEENSLAGIVRYQLLDLTIKCREIFENKYPLSCPDIFTRKCRIVINTVFFDDESKWVKPKDAQEYVFGLQKRISNWEYKDMNDYFYDELRNMGISSCNSVYVPSQKEKFWICTCGIINDINSERCLCGADKEKIFSFFEDNSIKQKYDIFVKKREEENQERIRRRKAIEQREKDERLKALALAKAEEEKMAEQKRKQTIIEIVSVGILLILLLLWLSIL